jgi:hypothetical protein
LYSPQFNGKMQGVKASMFIPVAPASQARHTDSILIAWGVPKWLTTSARMVMLLEKIYKVQTALSL